MLNKTEHTAYESSPAHLFDPRPDLEADHNLWTALLGAAWVRDPDTAGVLHGIRCEGARLERDRAFGLKLTRGEDLTQPEWDERRQRWLAPRREAVVSLLRAAAEILDRRPPEEVPVEVPPDRILPIAVPSGRSQVAAGVGGGGGPNYIKADYGKPTRRRTARG